MTDTPSRLFGLVLVLVGIWVLTYWLYDPRGPRVTADPSTKLGGAMVAPPVAPPMPVEPPQRTDLPPLPEITPATAPTGSKRVQKVIPPEFREYVVQKGDVSFEAIAARREVYGDRAKWPAVSQANPYVSPDRLKPGVTRIRIAIDPENIQGKLVWVDERGNIVSPETPTPERAKAAALAETDISYIIAEDDTLWSIAKKMYGQGAQWKRIYEANTSVIKDPDRPPKGAKIVIPPPELGHAGD